MRESALIVSKTLGMIASEIKEGVTTLHLDKLAEEEFAIMAPFLVS
jgi:methionyl aminopeptidase